MPALYLLIAFSTALAFTVLLNAIALGGWRQSQGQHWSLRARALWPARLGQVQNVLFLPLGIMAGLDWAFPGGHGWTFWIWVAGMIGVQAGGWPLTKTMYPQATWSSTRHQWLLGWGLTGARITLYIFVGRRMAEQINPASLAMAAGVVAYDLWQARGGLIRFVRWLGFYRPAPPKLAELVANVSAGLQLKPPVVWVTASPQANAFAFVLCHALLFTDALLANLSEEELRGIVAHELAHLMESRTARIGRLAGLLGWWPLLFLGPLLQRFGPPAFLGLAVWWMVLGRMRRAFSRRMELRADAAAVSQEAGTEPAYARALAQIHKANWIPAVATKNLTHPHLYDRMIAAGVQPDFPRPEPPARFHPFCFLVYVAIGVFVVLRFMWMTNVIHHVR